MTDIEELEREILARIEADRSPLPCPYLGIYTNSCAGGGTASCVCEPRPRAVPAVGSPVVEPPTPLPAPAVGTPGEAQDGLLPDWVSKRVNDVFFPEAAKFDTWLRGFDYDFLGEGHYEDTDI